MNSFKSKLNFPMDLSKGTRKISLAQIIIVFLLSLTIAIAAIPGYLTGKWSWADLPPVTELKQLAKIRTDGLSLPGWTTIKQEEVRIGGNKWSWQIIEKEGQTPITLMLMPQNYYKNYPNVEWTDIQGLEKWKTDSHTILKFKASEGSSHQVKARFFRGWNKETAAIVQWYAWPKSGNFASYHWFWQDQIAQLRRQRVPWIAVYLKIPVEPLSNVKEIKEFAQSLAEKVQINLDKQFF
ncbi:MAG TPA: cyanoexosortase B system-associated protein [Cyanothece sp. UBA12306]|nr:cyanoexosortase B system-associated protein [Cyanothece sp. UBA12306]